MKPETVTTEDAECAIAPVKNYDALHDDSEDAADAEAQRLSRTDSDQETIPAALVDRLCAGGNPVRTWREYRGMSPACLAMAADLPDHHLSSIESGNAPISPETLRRIANALRITVDDLAPVEDPSPLD